MDSCDPMGAPGRLFSRGESHFDRRRVALIIAVVAVLVGLGILSPVLPAPEALRSNGHSVPFVPVVSATSAGWPTFHGTETRTGSTPQNGPTVGSVVWLACPLNLSVPIRAAPVANATRIYVVNVFGGIFALDRGRAGSVLWNTAIGAAPVTPELTPTALIVGGFDGVVHAFNVATGASLWASPGLGSAIVQGLALDNGSLFVGTSAGLVASLSSVNGVVQWKVAAGGPVAGALAVSGGILFGTTTNGTLFAITEAGKLLWSRGVGASLASAPALDVGRIFVGDLGGNVSAFSAANGSRIWSASASGSRGAPVNETPAVGGGRVFVQTDLGTIAALNETSGTALWRTSVTYSGYPALPSPALAPNGLYFVDESQDFADWSPSNGSLLWRTSFNSVNSFASPALDSGQAILAFDSGCVEVLGSPGGPLFYPVTGSVVDIRGHPIPNATVGPIGAGIGPATTGINGNFRLLLPNGSYTLLVDAIDHPPAQVTVVVAGGPVVLPPVALANLVLYPVSGRVVDASSGLGLSGALLIVAGNYGYTNSTATSVGGLFAVPGPSGLLLLTAGGLEGYSNVSLPVRVNGSAVSAVEIALPPVSLGRPNLDSANFALWLPLIAVVTTSAGFGAWELRRRRVALGLPPAVLSPFARFVVMRASLIPVQALALLTLLYFVGTVLVAVAHGAPVGGFLNGYGQFIERLFTGQWGDASYGALVAPATQLLGWWFGDSLELALLALPIAALIAYPVGLLAGWREGGVADASARSLSLVGLLLPSFLLVLAILTALFDPFQRYFGDPPYGTLPSFLWFEAHGGVPNWIGIGGNTGPTSLPVIDGILHGDWAFVGLVLAKSLLQAFAIAVVYVAVFLRYARHAVAESAREPYVQAARARGIPERTILWKHLGFRVWPIYFLIIGITLPVYVGTQALVEALSNDTGLGSLLLSEVTRITLTGFGFSRSPFSGNFYQVAIFLLLLVVLVANLASDVLARYLDPRLLRSDR